jgi:hypothetical protein
MALPQTAEPDDNRYHPTISVDGLSVVSNITKDNILIIPGKAIAAEWEQHRPGGSGHRHRDPRGTDWYDRRHLYRGNRWASRR